MPQQLGIEGAAGPRRWAGPALVAAAALLAYAWTLTFPLLWDDKLILENLKATLAQKGAAGLLTAEFLLDPSQPTGYFRPVVLASFWLDHRLSAIAPFSFHLTNILLHAGNSLLVLRLLSLMSLGRGSALFGALLFAAHPVHVESVAFVSGRTDLWMTLFVLLSVLAWLGGRTGPGGGPPRARLLGAGAFFLALLSKEAALALPAVLLAWDALRGGGPGGERAGWRERNLPWLFAWALAIGLAAALRWGAAGLGPDLAQRLGGASPDLGLLARMWVRYFALLVAPWPLNAYYTPAQVTVQPGHLAAALFLVGACLFLGGRGAARAGWLSLAWIAGFLLPAGGLVPISGEAVMAERLLYLPSVGLALLAASAAERLAARRPSRVPALAAALLVGLFACASVARSGIWKDELTLFENVVKASPDAASMHYNLGALYLARGRAVEAARSLEEAVRRSPRAHVAHFVLGNAYLDLGRRHDAVAMYRRAIEIKPDYVGAYKNLGHAYLLLGMVQESRSAFARAVEIGRAAAPR